MKTLKKILILAVLLAFAPLAYAQQNTLIQTTLTNAITSSATTIVVGSATGITAPTGAPGTATSIYIDRELLTVTAVNGTAISVARGANGTAASGHAAATMVLAGRPNWFYISDPYGSCVTASTLVTPYLNVRNHNEWLCSSVTLDWGPGWGNLDEPPQVTAAVASAAGQVTPSGPMFHITGALAITGFLTPIGMNATGGGGGCFVVIPDGAFTWTTANNIALAGTAVVNKALTFCWDATNSKWIPNYIA
jgi:hypothetical protein